MSVRRFEPVWLPAGAIDGAFSVTLGQKENLCPRSAFLYALYRGGAASHEMERGSALHRVLELATLAAIEQGEEAIPPEVVKAIVDEVLADPEYRCRVEEHDYIREAAYRWAEDARFDPAAVVAVETLLVLDLGPLRLRGKVDLAMLLEGGAAVLVRDYKSSRHMPGFEDIGRRRPDGSVAAKDYQLVAYALLLAFGRPVRREVCGRCGGSGKGGRDRHTSTVEGAAAHAAMNDVPETAAPVCGGCGGRGTVEVEEPFALAERAQRFDLEYAYPGIEAKDGGMATRPVSLTRLELEEYRASFEAQAGHIAHRVETGEWPAVRGDHCSECPCPVECPIPASLRSFAGTINTPEQAREAAEQLDAEKAVHKARWEEIKRFVKRMPGQRLRFGRDQVIEPGFSQSERIADKDAMFAAMERAVRYGEPFERARFVKTVQSTRLAQRRLTEAELAEELAEGSNEEEAA